MGIDVATYIWGETFFGSDDLSAIKFYHRMHYYVILNSAIMTGIIS